MTMRTIYNDLPVEIVSDHMVPRLKLGQIAVFDGDQIPEAGEIVCVALEASQEILIGRYTPGGGGYSLTFDNTACLPRPIRSADRPAFFGTMTAVHELLRSR